MSIVISVVWNLHTSCGHLDSTPFSSNRLGFIVVVLIIYNISTLPGSGNGSYTHRLGYQYHMVFPKGIHFPLALSGYSSRSLLLWNCHVSAPSFAEQNTGYPRPLPRLLYPPHLLGSFVGYHTPTSSCSNPHMY